MKPLLLSGLLLMTAFAAVPAVSAAEAVGSVNVRSGPGTSYRVVDRLARGENVNVQRCRSSGWCYITHPGPDGWVTARTIARRSSTTAPTGRRARPAPISTT